jgi:hypothetical protein
MGKQSLIGPGYIGRATSVNASRCINFYPEANGPDSKTDFSLVGTPGSHFFASAGATAVRGTHVFNGVTYIVVGDGLYYLNMSTKIGSSKLGTLATSTGRVQMSDNGIYPAGGNQLIIVDGTATYVYNVSDFGINASTTNFPQQDNNGNLSKNWSGITTGTDQVTGEEIFVAVSSGSHNAGISTDGLTWEIISMPLVGYNSVTWNGNVFCAVGGGVKCATSPDGRTWTSQTISNHHWSSVTALGTLLVAVSGASNDGSGTASAVSARSTDNGVTWTDHALPVTGMWNCVIASGTQFLALCQDVTPYIGAGSNVVATSPDGQTWTQQTTPDTVFWACAAWSPTLSLFCIMGQGKIYTSPTGVTWTQRTPYGGLAVVWTRSIFYAIGNGYSSSSADGITWTLRTIGLAYIHYGMAWNSILNFACATASDQSLYYAVSAITMPGNYFDGTAFIRVTYLNNGVYNNLAASTVAFINGYFVIDFGGDAWQPLNLYDGTRFDILNKTHSNVSNDSVIAVYSSQGYLLTIGNYTSQIWYLTGQASPLFALMSGGTFDYGCAARYSIVKASNTLYWLANTRNNEGGELFGVMAMTGSGMAPVSTPAISYLFAQIAKNYGVSDCWAYSFIMEGHEFIRFTFPSDNAGAGSTYQYDTTTQQWSEVMSYPYSWSSPGRHIANTYFSFGGKHYVGSYTNGNIYEMSSEFYDDFGNAITSNKITFPTYDMENLNNVFISSLQLDAEPSGINFSAVSDGSTVAATTRDALTWTQRTQPNDRFLAQAWNGTVYCAVGITRNTITSPDGITWTSHTNAMPNVSASWSAITSIGGIFCAVNYGTAIAATSPDGVTWTQRTLPENTGWNAITSNGTILIAVGIGATKSAVSYDNGATWSQGGSISGYAWSGIACNGTVFCIIGSGGTGIVATSTNGAAWTFGTLPRDATWAIASNGTIFCAVASGTAIAATSSNGLVWTARTLPVSDNWYTICWNGVIFLVIAWGSLPSLISSDGIAWTLTAMPNINLKALAVNSLFPNNKISVSWSKDGAKTWNTPTYPGGDPNDPNSRLIWYGIGAARQWAFNIQDTRTTKKVLLAAYLNYDKGQ